MLVANTGGAAPDVEALLHDIATEQSTENLYRVYFSDIEWAKRAVISFHHGLIASDYSKGYLLFELEPNEVQRLQSYGFSVELAVEEIQQRNRRLEAAKAKVSETQVAERAMQSIPGFDCYETVEETYAAAENVARDYPNIADWIDIGDSWEKTEGLGGFDLNVLVLTNRERTGEKPKLFVHSAMHAREYTTAPLNLRFARWLAEGYGVDADATWILDHHEIHLMLHMNPDGRKQAETGLSWRKNTNRDYCGTTSNSRGADLNRNFTWFWDVTNGQGSSGNVCSSTFRGTSPASEPETQAVEAYVRSLWPDRRGPSDSDAAPRDTSGIHLDIHSSGRLVLWPYGQTSTPAPNGMDLQTLGRKFAFFNGHDPRQSIGLYPTDGTSDDVSYAELGVAAYTFELGTQFFEQCSYFEEAVVPDNLPALVHAAKVVRTPYITGGGPDVQFSLEAGASTQGVVAGTPVALNGVALDTRFSQDNGTEPTHAISRVEYVIDTPPWEASSNAVAVAASDGAYDATTESIGATIPTTGLSAGRHLVFARAQDTTGTWGAVSAQFLVIRPESLPECVYVADFETGLDGWTAGSSSCTTGAFVQGAPDLFTDGGRITQAGLSSTGLGALFTSPNSAVGTDDVDGGTCEVVSPVIDGAGAEAVEVSLAYYFGQRDSLDDDDDGLTIEVLNDGQVAATLVSLGDRASDAVWKDVSTVIAEPGQVQLRVRATDGAADGDIIEAGIDGVRVCLAGAAPPPPPTSQCSYAEGFESGAGSFTNTSASTCSTGAFVAGVPSTQENGGVVTQVGSASEGTQAWFTSPNTSAGADDVDGGVCISESSAIAVAEASTLSVAYFHGQRDAADDAGDFFRLELSTDGGSTFTTLAENGDSVSQANWSTAAAPLAAGDVVVLRVQCADGSATGDLVECGIDDVSICPSLD